MNRASLVAQMVKNLPAMQETRFKPWVGKIPLEKEMAIHSSILAWKIPWTEEPGRLQSMGSQRVGHDWATNTFALLNEWVELDVSEVSSKSNILRSFKILLNFFFVTVGDCKLLPWVLTFRQFAFLGYQFLRRNIIYRTKFIAGRFWKGSGT